jgi:TPP-dependent pyruvate/acetoin dehydrogenase alpha subunit
MAGVRSRSGGTPPQGTNCTLNRGRVNTLENAAPRQFSADGPVGSVVPIGAGTAFALGTGNENPGQF